MLRFHLFPPSPRAFKVLAVANHLGLDYETRMVHLFEGDQHRPLFATLNPNRQMPVLEEDGVVLWESNAILQYLASKVPSSGLMPTPLREQAQVNQWQFWDLAHWDPAIDILLTERVKKAIRGQGGPDPVEVERGERRFHYYAGVLDGHLKGRSFIACERLTLADFSIGSFLNAAEIGHYPLEPYAEIRRWYAHLAGLPAWRKTLKETQPQRGAA